MNLKCYIAWILIIMNSSAMLMPYAVIDFVESSGFLNMMSAGMCHEE